MSAQVVTGEPCPLSQNCETLVLKGFITVGNPVVACILSQGMFHASCEFGRSKVLTQDKSLGGDSLPASGAALSDIP